VIAYAKEDAMEPLTLDDILPLDDYIVQRQDYFSQHIRYLDRYRRVRLGPKLTLLFENRQTLWFRLHEVLRVARLDDAARVQAEIDWYNQLLPSENRLQAALLIGLPDNAPIVDELRFWRGLTGAEIAIMCNGVVRIEGQLVTAREADLSIGMAHWIEFPCDAVQKQALSASRGPMRIQVQYRGYEYESLPLSEDIRQSLSEDLEPLQRVA